MGNIEKQYVKNLDAQKTSPNQEVGDQGKAAEKAVADFLRSVVGMETRPATKVEDSGLQQIVKDKAIDIVGYLEGRPAIGIQITTATDSKVRSNKTNDLINRPFIRLFEMTSSDVAIPRSLVFVDAVEIKSFLFDQDITKHPKLARQIIEGNIASLKIDLMKTKNPKEQDLVNKQLALFETIKDQF